MAKVEEKDVEALARKMCALVGRDPDALAFGPVDKLNFAETPRGSFAVTYSSVIPPLWTHWSDMARMALQYRETL